MVDYRCITVKYDGMSYTERYKGKLGEDFTVSFSSRDAVPDSMIGYLTVTKENAWFARGCKVTPTDNKYRKIALLLESPHKDEYTKDGIPLLPAQGVTGDKIARKITSRPFIKDIEPGEYVIYLVNPIRFQSSAYLVLGTKYCRGITDKIFKILYKQANLRSDFVERLTSYKVDYAVNCCTCKLKKVILDDVKVIVDNLLSDSHPASW